jgi:ATP adenylyltransferase
MTLAHACTICAEFGGEEDGNLFHAYRGETEIESRILAETRNFVAIPSLGQLVEGYVLICTRAHYFSIGAALLKKPELRIELANFKRKVQVKLREVYGSRSIAFEHGAASFTNRAGCCTDHAHIHIVPTEVDLISRLAKTSLRWDGSRLSQLFRYAAGGNAYLYYEDVRGDGISAVADAPIPSQLFRRILSAELGRPDEWDWRQNPGMDRLVSAIKRFASCEILGTTQRPVPGVLTMSALSA